MCKPGHTYRSLKPVHIEYENEDEFSMISFKTPREILSKNIECYRKKAAERGFRVRSDNDPRHTTKAIGEVIARKSQACWTD